MAVTQTQEYDPIQARTRAPRVYDARSQAGRNSTGASRTAISRIRRRSRVSKKEKALEKALTSTTPVGRAYRVARRIARMSRAKQKAKMSEKSESRKKLTGVPFVIMVMLALAKDFLDWIFTATVFLSLFLAPIQMLILIVILFYYYYNNVRFTMKKTAVMVATIIIEALPLIGMLVPATTLNLFIIRALENSKTAKKAAAKLSMKKSFT